MSQFSQYPAPGPLLFSAFSAFPAAAANGQLALALDTDTLYAFNTTSMSWVTIGGASSVLIIGTFDGQAPVANGAVISANSLFLQSATAAFPGLVNISTQTFAGNKTFTGTITASNLSGTNTGDVTLAAFGSTPNANAASLSGQILTLQPADGTNPGGVSTGTQTFAGAKTFTDQVTGSSKFTTGENPTDNVGGTQGDYNVGSASGNPVFMGIQRSNNSTGAQSYLVKSRGTMASPLIVQNGDNVGSISAFAYDGAAYGDIAKINIQVDGAPGAGSTPGRILFSTTPTGTSIVAEVLRLSQDKSATFSGNAVPVADGTLDLGSSSAKWRDLYLSDSSIRMGTTPAASGAIRLPNTKKVSWRNLANTQDNSIWVENTTVLGFDPFVFDTAGGSAPYSAGIFLDWPLATLANRGFIYAGAHVAGDALIEAATNAAYNINGTPINQASFESFDVDGGVTNTVFVVGVVNSSPTSCGTSSYFKARGTPAVPTASVSGDSLGQIIAYGHDGTDFEAAAKIVFTVNGTTSNNVMPGAVTIQTTPDSSNVPANALSVNRNKQLTLFGGGLSSSSSLYAFGSIFSGGTASTTKPQILIEPAGATSTNWNTSGTALGVNASSGFGGNLIDLQVNAVQKFSVSGSGTVSAANAFQGTASSQPTAGFFRMLTTGAIAWRNNANSGNILLAKDTSDSLTYNGNVIVASDGTISSGVAAGTTGQLNLSGSTSGTVSVKVADTAGTWTLTLPTNDGNSGQYLKTDGSGVTSWDTPAGNLTIDRFSGNASTVNFTLSVDPGTENNTWAYISGVYQQKDTYSVSGTTLTFSTAPPTGTNNIEVVTGSSLSIGTPADGTVTFAKLASSTLVAPTIQKFTSSSGTYTTPTSPRTPLYIRVSTVGGGGGGGSSGTAAFGAASAGGNTTFGTALLTSNGGSAGAQSGNIAGGSATVNSPATTLVANTGAGSQGAHYNNAYTVQQNGGMGAATPLGGGGGGGAYGNAGQAAIVNTGAGGGGGGGPAGSTSGYYAGAGGGAGGYLSAIITVPSATYAYAVGAAGSGGTAGTSGFAGGAGGSGVIIVEEYYQ